ncbi:Glyoxylase, beta-lactamase superfamily II [Paracoccus alcaliphilus]|uniref:Glyoxylase, beta-lactamase superfamily II n=2 Tax=Paracoccus alcaliphilus TaxID=34002 RepID=A0A1H8L4E5_9RHOB|nr:MBL fold metallo-hydrolase [Paracoccus alcaliphilus]SEN99538.1 Glyoxylase, beta-lactamase superfamily II [Paracoccus alcaliphilus]
MQVRQSPSQGAGSPDVTGFYDEATGSCQYLVSCPLTKEAALIDVVQEFDPRSASCRHDAARWALAEIKRRGLVLAWILDTHPHADHLMASAWLKQQTGAPNAIGEGVTRIAALWEEIYHMPGAFDASRHFDRLFAEGDRFALGQLEGRVMLSPGHTPGSVTYVIGDAAFVHDTFMQPDAGTSRADFPGGSSAQLYDSLMAILALPDETRLFVGHDYGTRDRQQPEWESTVARQRADNIHIGGGTSRAEYIALRDRRDATLALPDRMLYALQVNLRAGRLPAAESDGRRYFKIPADYFAPPRGD